MVLLAGRSVMVLPWFPDHLTAIIEATSVASAKQAITRIPQTWHDEPR